MPELPEVETLRQDLSKEVVGKKVKTVAVTNGRSVRVFRVSMEVCADGVVEPSVFATPLLPLFGGATGDVPAGFAALVRLLSASPAQLCELATPPFDVCLTVAGAPLQLEERIGTGGFSNVYATHFQGQAAVVKCAHVGGRTPIARASLAHEAKILRALNAARCPGVPQLLAECDLSVAMPPLPGAKAARATPLALACLVLEPRGMPLCALAAALGSDEERRVLARRVASDVLHALRGAHAAGIVHGDGERSEVLSGVDEPSGVIRVGCVADDADYLCAALSQFISGRL